MKVTALISDELVKSVREIAQGASITESLVIALKEWVSTKRLLKLSEEVKKRPLRFSSRSVATKVRALNRRTR